MPRKREYSEDKVLEKAMGVFWDNGYEATSIRRLEKEMGINQFSIYASFGNKKNLFIASLKKYRQFNSTHGFKNLLKEDARLKDLENFFYHFMLPDGENHPGCLVVNTTGEVGANDPEIRAELSNYYLFVKEMLRNILQNSVNAGELSAQADLEKYSNYLLSVMQGLSVSSKIAMPNQVRDSISMALKCIV